MSNQKLTYEELLEKVNLLEQQLSSKGKGFKILPGEYELVLNAIPMLIWYMTDESTIGSVNTAFANFFNRNISEIENTDIRSLVSEEVGIVSVSTNKIVFETKKPYKREGWVVNGKGEKRLLHIIKSPHIGNDDKVQYVVCIADDITEKRAMEKALQENEEKYRLIFENSPVGILHYNNEGTVTDCNEAFLQIFKMERKEIIGVNLNKAFYDTMLHLQFMASLHGKYTFYEGFMLPFSKTEHIKADFAPIFSEEGKIIGGIGLIEDIAKKKR